MFVRVWFVVAVLFALTHFSISARKEFSIGEICDNMAAYLNLINPILNFKIELDFKKGGMFLHNRGVLVFTSEFIISDCKAFMSDSKIFIMASVTNSFFIHFTERPRVFIENGSLNITATCGNISYRRNRYNKMKGVRFTSVNLVHMEKAHVNLKFLNEWFMRPLRDLISLALTEYASKKFYFLCAHDQVSESKAIAAFSSAFQYYMYRL